jgi:hypothetical protein
MKTIGLGCVALLVGCGGSGGTDLPDGSTDSSTDGTTTNDTGANDTGKNDTGSNDAADSGGDSSDGATFTPLDVLGLVLWLEGDVSSSLTTVASDAGPSRITKWADQTTHHNDATASISLPTRDPTVNATGINSLPTVHFNQGTGGNGSSGQMLTVAENTDTSLDWGTGDFFVAVVGDFDNDISNGQNLGVGNFFSKSSAFGATTSYTGPLLYGNLPSLTTNPTVGLLFGTGSGAMDAVTTTTAYNTGSPHLFVTRRRGAQIDLFVDGTNVATATSGTVDVTNLNSLRIGADGDANLVRLDGDIGEMIAVKGVLTMPDEASLNLYLKTKWATP